MVELSDESILDKISRRSRETKPEFSLDDLVGKTISSRRKIKNPRDYDPEVTSPNPEYFNVLEFSDGTFLLTENWGDGDCEHIDFFYFNGQKTLYSSALFSDYMYPDS